MKKIFYLLFIISILLASCKKEEEYQCNCENTFKYLWKLGSDSDDYSSLGVDSSAITNEYVMAKSMEEAETGCNNFNYSNSTIISEVYTNQMLFDSIYTRTDEVYNCILE